MSRTTLWLPLLAIVSCLASAQFEGVTYGLPKGWKQIERKGALVLIPGDLEQDQAFLVMVSPPEETTAEAPSKQFEAIVRKVNADSVVSTSGEQGEAPLAGGTLFAQAFVVEDKELGKHARMVLGLFVGKRRMTFVVVMDPGTLVDKYEAAVLELVGSVKFKPEAPKTAAPDASGAKRAPTGETPQFFPGMAEWRPSGRGVPLPATAIVDGKPVGLWYKSDTLSEAPKANRYVFFPDGTYLTNPRWGGGSIIDVDAQRQITPTSTGTYRISEGKLSTQTSGFKSRAEAFSHGKDAFGLFFKQGAAVYRELKAPTVARLAGTWRAQSTQYVFREDGTFQFGQVSSGYEWIAGSVAPGTFFVDGHLVVLEFTGRHTTVVPIDLIGDRQLLIGTSLLVRSSQAPEPRAAVGSRRDAHDRGP